MTFLPYQNGQAFAIVTPSCFSKGMQPNDDAVGEIKRRVDIVDFIGQYVQLKKGGQSFKGLCPFHQEKTPSFTVNQERQSWYCFGGCSEGGDIFTFVEKIENVDFRGALELLAGRIGLELKPPSPEERQQKNAKARLYEMYDLATRFYHKLLLDHPLASVAREYCDKRGVSADSIAKWRLGFAPDRWDALLNALMKRGYSVEEVIESGLAAKNERGKTYDRFRNRLLFPITTVTGRVVAFSGRALDAEQTPKYLNSPETLLYKKSQTVMGLPLAKEAIRQKDRVIVVEGNLDVLICQQLSYLETVATGGTALTLDHLQLLGRYTENVIFAFDADSAGQKAAYKAAQLALKAKLSPRFMKLPEGEDPDSLLRSDPEAFRLAVSEALPAVAYFLNKAIAEHGLTSAVAKKSIGQDLKPILDLLSDPIERADSVRLVAERLRVPTEAVTKMLDAAGQAAAPVMEVLPANHQPAGALVSPKPELLLLGLLFLSESPLPALPPVLETAPSPNLETLRGLRDKGVGSKTTWAAWLASEPQARQERINKAVAMTAGIYGEATPAEMADEIAQLIKLLDQRAREAQQKDVQWQIKEAETKGDKAAVRALLKQLIDQTMSSS